MGVLEKRSRQRRALTTLQRALLAFVAISGLLLLAAVAPNTLKLLKHVPMLKKSRAWSDTRTALSRLVKQGYVTFVEKDGKRYARITTSGKEVLAFEKQRALLQKCHKKRWDKHWRIVIFDIPEKIRHLRNQLRREMQEAGFVQLQASVWVHAYDCEDFIALLKANLHIGKRVIYIIADTVENDRGLQKQFGVSA